MGAIRVSVVFFVVVIGLTCLQLLLDSGGQNKILSHKDNKFAATFQNFNACSSRSYSDSKQGRKIQESLPRALRTFPMRAEGRADTCDTMDRGIFLRNGSTTPKKLCDKLFQGRLLTEEEGKWIKENSQSKEDVAGLLSNTSDCAWVQAQLTGNYYVSDKERNFPIAYAINLNKYPNQIFRLLKVIYRSHNVYCLHYDLKSAAAIKEIIFNIASCMDNVILPRKIESVYWGWYTLEEAYANCFSDLMLAREHYPWKYVINLCGKELPLRTSAETVALLEPLNGTSSIQILPGRNETNEFKVKHKVTLNKLTGWLTYTYRDSSLLSIPYNLKVYKSWAHIALSNQFVEFYLCHEVGITLREFMKGIYIPDENIYAMLFMKPGVPGGYDPKFKDDIFPVIHVYTCIWLDGPLYCRLYYKFFYHSICSGGNVHNICMVGAGDLHKLSYKSGVKGHWNDVSGYKQFESDKHGGGGGGRGVRD